MHRLVVWVFAVAASGCATYSYRHAALVPTYAPPLRSGQPMEENRLEVGVGNGSVVSADEPGRGADDNAGIVVPRHDVNGQLRIRAHRNVDVGFVYDRGLDAQAVNLRSDQPTPDNGDVWGGGPRVMAGFDITPELRVGMVFDALLYSIPYITYSTCVADCALPWDEATVSRGRGNVAVVGASVLPSYRIGRRLAVFAGMHLRNHPTIRLGNVGTYDDTEPEDGPLGMLVNAGAEVELGAGVRALVEVHQATREIASYAPTLAVSVSVPLVRDPPRRAPVAEVARR